MKRFLLLGLFAILLPACAAAPLPAAPTQEPVPAVSPLPGFDPTDPEVVFGDGLETSPLFQPLQPEMLVSVADLADLPGNAAAGEAAPDFAAHLVGGETFTLAAQQGTPVLIIPTALGCAECVANLRGLAVVYPDFRGRGLTVLVLDIVSGDEPEMWQRFADYLNEPDILWGVVASPQFAADYDILSLGTVLLVNAEGRLVFRSENPLTADGFRQLLDLATAPAPTPTPLPTAVPPTPTHTSTPEPAGFAAVPGNVATDQTAPDVRIKTLNGAAFNLSDMRGQYVLLLPTVPGCGQCMVHLNMLDGVYPDYRGQGVQVILLDLYPENNPGYWEFLANQFHEPDYIWGVVESADFVLDYEITTLGTVLLVDPEGIIVYRSEKLIPADTFRQLFDLATS